MGRPWSTMTVRSSLSKEAGLSENETTGSKISGAPAPGPTTRRYKCRRCTRTADDSSDLCVPCEDHEYYIKKAALDEQAPGDGDAD